MAFTRQDVDYIAKLARITLSDDEQKNFTRQLDSILEYVNKLNELDTDSVEPTAHILPVQNVFREDEVKPCADSKLAVEQSPELRDGLFIVPPVIE
ncbi:MAG: Asp-tRNA(Asn)/Glu-tRNA(Gln) amidotransferase subunit GatC [Candidatus Auribacterota bacterium]|jgi:aspartyl-tRNA(Asn)/glutamyl-tRNA(Gln) amidotransferase subunit C|nr:Asp-tRNA(Asn)/Glu-tRNA(Gln) amidotransferase subunit GatC [Candidatus Auribacterota bacterium]